MEVMSAKDVLTVIQAGKKSPEEAPGKARRDEAAEDEKAEWGGNSRSEELPGVGYWMRLILKIEPLHKS